ncbi:MAG: hypothetical protein ACRD2A_00525 [Vicinamibacterales bacterium]
MKIFAIRAALALVFATGGWLCWREAGLVDDTADARMRLALLRDDAADATVPRWNFSDVVLNDAVPMAAHATRGVATANYWRGRYADAMDIGRQEIDPGLLLIAANAAFRASQRESSVGQPAVQRLDGVLQAYASVLKAAPRQTDAAYNYEYVARVRDALAQAPLTRTKAEAAAAPTPRSTASDLPTGLTLHGQPGAPPPEVRAEDFQIIAPMEFGDREAQPEPTPGGKLPRKG